MPDPAAANFADVLADVIGELSQFAERIVASGMRPQDSEKLLAETHSMLRRALLKLGDDPDAPEPKQKRLAGFAGDLNAREHLSKGAISAYRPRGGGAPGSAWPVDMSLEVQKRRDAAAKSGKGKGR